MYNARISRSFKFDIHHSTFPIRYHNLKNVDIIVAFSYIGAHYNINSREGVLYVDNICSCKYNSSLLPSYFSLKFYL